jgi:hypothetical protein
MRRTLIAKLGREIMQDRTNGKATGGLRSVRVNLVDRRLFLSRLAALGGAAVSIPGLNFVIAAESPQNSAPAPARTASVVGGRGKVQQVGGEIKEYMDPKTGRIYSTMHERYYQHPHSVVMRTDTESGEAVAAWGEATWISHVLIHPTRPNLILFCHVGGGTCVKQRMGNLQLRRRELRQRLHG